MENNLKNHLNTLTEREVKNLKSHASLADQHGENHDSHKALHNWLKGLSIFGGAVITIGMTSKLIKTIINH